jgi:TatD DNase family protein
MFVDSHCHLELESFDKDRTAVIARAVDQGVGYMVTVATEERYFDRAVGLIEGFEQIYGSLGVHPHNAMELTDTVVERMTSLFRHEKVLACGEIGLDFFRNYAPKDAQITAFTRQVDLAGACEMPIIVHSRDAKEETLHILEHRHSSRPPGIIHCYSYDVAAARRFLDLGFFISIPGTITYGKNNGLEEVVRFVPGDRLLSETDAPFLTPHPMRGKRNEPSLVAITVRRMAELRREPVEELAATLLENFQRAFLRAKEAVLS